MAYRYDEYGNVVGWDEEPGLTASNSGNQPPLRQYSMEYADTPNGKPNNNLGSPGSRTEATNSQWKQWGDPWVDTGDTGGSLNGVTTVKAGSSMTEADRQRYLNAAAKMEIPASWIDSFLGRNNDDESRLMSAYQSELNPKNDDGAGLGPPLTPGGGGGADNWLRSMLKGIGTNGALNQDIISRRASNASDRLNAGRKSQLATNEAYLASRGLIGDGPQKTANENLESRLGQSFNDAMNEIYANEGENADSRMMQALSLAAGLDIADANRLVDWFRAQTERDSSEGQLGLGWGRLGLDTTLGQGQLALGNMNGVNNFNLGLAQLGLDRDKFLSGIDQQDYDRLMQLIEQLNSAGQTSAGGYY